MNDRELLLLAAKAIGAQPYDWDTSRDGLFIQASGMVWLANGDHDADWNPLVDDTDAFRLSAELGINIGYNIFNGDPCAWRTRQYQDVSCVEPCGDDKTAALRRAIVRAAAEIGKQHS